MSKALPKLDSLCILAAVVEKLQVLMDESLSKNSENIETSRSTQNADSAPSNRTKIIIEILPHILSLTDAILSCQSNMLYHVVCLNLSKDILY